MPRPHQRRLGGPTAEPATIRSTLTTERSASRTEADAQPDAATNRGIALNGDAAPSSGPSRPAELRPDSGIGRFRTATGPDAGEHASAAPTTAGDPVPRSGPGELRPALSNGAGLNPPITVLHPRVRHSRQLGECLLPALTPDRCRRLRAGDWRRGGTPRGVPQGPRPHPGRGLTSTIGATTEPARSRRT
jgi:hypothetical protein